MENNEFNENYYDFTGILKQVTKEYPPGKGKAHTFCYKGIDNEFSFTFNPKNQKKVEITIKLPADPGDQENYGIKNIFSTNEELYKVITRDLKTLNKNEQ